MKTELHTIREIIDRKIDTPLDIAVIPNHMGINLSEVEAMNWTQQDDGQLVRLTIHFTPGAHRIEKGGARCIDCGMEIRGKNDAAR
jgi:hypothetical protein